MKRAISALVVFVSVAGLLSGCGDAGDIWRDEFDARLDGAAATIEEAREAAERIRDPVEYLTVLSPFGPRLADNSRLIEELKPPTSCEAVQVKGKAAVSRAAERIGNLFKDLTPEEERDLPSLFEYEVATIEKRQHEAETCT